MMLVIIFVIFAILFAIILFHEQVREFISAACVLIAEFIREAYIFFIGILRKITDWLRHSNSEVHHPVIPVNALIGTIALAVGIFATYANWNGMKKTLEIILPWDVVASMVALSLAIITGLMGVLYHYLQTRLERAVCLAMIGLLVLVIGLLSYMRVSETTKVPIYNQAEEIHGQLVVDGQDVQVSQEKEQDEIKGVSFFESSAWLATGMAVLLTVTEAITYYGAFKLADSAMVWFLSSPVLLIFALPSAIFYLLDKCRAAKALGIMLNTVVKGCEYLGAKLAELRLYLTKFTKSGREKRKSEAGSEMERWQAAQEAEREKRQYQREELKLDREFISNLNAKQRHLLESCLEIICDAIRNSYYSYSKDFSTKLIDQAIIQSKEKLNIAAEHMASSLVLPDILNFTKTVDGKRLLKSMLEKKMEEEEIYNEIH